MYIYCTYRYYNIHNLPIKLKKHAALRLIQRFDLSIEELRYVFKTGKMIKAPKKPGDIGIIERRLGKKKIRVKFLIDDDTIWIITVEGGPMK